MNAKPPRTCPRCGHEVSGATGFCPVCLLRAALASEVESGESSIELAAGPALTCLAGRFEHYELVRGKGGQPLELGRGAMGVTFKAIDLALQRPVALKVIGEQCLGNASAQWRFVREARAAASIRHPNVASIFYLGQSGPNYFYAMELVEGETLEAFIARSGSLEVALALRIVAQVGAGLAAVHQQKLVHRDLKPANVMVNLEKGGLVTAKIIDLGLAKPVHASDFQTAISTPGSFVGTPEFASPEQFAGVPVDIRSDLYSLGATLWKMLTGQAPFRGSPAELMHLHLQTPPPREQLGHVPPPVVSLLETLLEKNPARRFQTPDELLKALPTVMGAIEPGSSIAGPSLQQVPTVAREPAALRGPEKISVARLPITANQAFGREEDLAILDAAWANPRVNVMSIVAWAGIGKSTLVNHWLRRMAADSYRSAELVFSWSFYRQGTRRGASSADDFLDATLAWFGDPDPRFGTAWQKGERLARLVAQRRTLLILDGLEPLQNPPGPQEGRLRESSLQALLRELAAFNKGLCVITTRLPVADLADQEGASAVRHDLDYLPDEAGAQLLRGLGVNGLEVELRCASQEFSGHCLALTLLGSYLTDAFDGDIRCRQEVSNRLVHDVRQGIHARKVMASYQNWFGEGPELSVLRLLGLFDRPVDDRALGILRKPPAIPGLTESLTGLSPVGWRTVLARLRRARLLAPEDPHNPGYLDAHPLVREYFGEQLRSERTEAWQESNRRLYRYYQAIAPPLPDSFRAMEPLFLAVTCACNAGLFREALHEVYLPRIQRGNAYFAANVLGARGALLSALVHFFEDGHWGSLVEKGINGRSLTAEDQLFILTQAGLYLSATRGFSAPEAQGCYERAEALCYCLNHPLLLYSALMGQWRYTYITGHPRAALPVAQRVYTLAQEQNSASIMLGACQALVSTLYYLGEFETARDQARRGVQIWRSGGLPSYIDDLDAPAVVCLCYEALCAWHFGEIASCQTTMAEAIALAKALGDANSIAVALHFAAYLAHYVHGPAEVERVASELIELSTRQHLAFWRASGVIFRGWARSVSGDTAEGISWIEEGIQYYRATGSMLAMPYWFALKAEALHVARCTSEALEAISEATELAQRMEVGDCVAELHRLGAVFLTAMGADEVQVEAAFGKAMSMAQQQKSISLLKRAEVSRAEYRDRKAGR